MHNPTLQTKEDWKPGTLLYPLPAVLVSCGDEQESNLLTVAWVGTICTNPPMLYISVRPERHSYEMIRRTMQFTVNLTTPEMAHATDFCGVRSGRDLDKWKETGLTPHHGHAVSCPAVEQSPLSIECRVKSIVPLGSHHMFIADVVNILADRQRLDKDGRFHLDQGGLLNYNHGAYYSQGEYLGHFGFSVKKPTTKRK